MNTQTQDPMQLQDEQMTPAADTAPEYVIPYAIRSQFRDILIGFFNESDKKLGAYKRAEAQAKAYFLTAYNIPVDAWRYRNPKERN